MLQQSKACAICGKMSSIGEPIDPHHILHRSQGGEDHPSNISMLCRSCHNSIHQEGWVIDRTDEALTVTQNGTVEVRRWYPPSPTFQGDTIEGLRVIADQIEDITQVVKFLDDEGLVATAHATDQLEAGTWKLRCEVIYQGMMHIPRGQRVQKLAALAESFGIRPAQASRWLKVREVFPEVISSQLETPLTAEFYAVAAFADDPHAAVELATERVLEGSYSVAKFRKEIKGEPVCSWLHDGACRLAQFTQCEECPERKDMK